ncbi:MAG: outer membrane protein assembly factor BamB [Inhella sp.]|uniref:outer membrane protein assembly factor BamB n=1 Tax=Inhella sp. TaxID=1921806 RepID=UPI0022C4A2AB|nr:outer membrane protein assembly factor BamB [Inhella sp.]MCZ8236148.1 outer membrane protein assembly factor BamB [Inhella sp.]
MTRRVSRWGAACLVLPLAVWVSGCSLFGGDTPKPKELQALTSAGTARLLWSSRVGSVEFPLAVAASGDRFTVADSSGTVVALRAQDGGELWRAQVGDKLAAGVGSDGRFAAVVTRNQELVVIEAGQVLWRKAMKSPVMTSPLVAGERVFVQAVDRSVHAFDAQDGRKLWELARPGDALLLAHPGGLIPYKDTLVVGQGPRLAGVDPLRGTMRWEANLANPRGTNEVERLADVVGPLVRVGDLICGRAFQSAVGCLSAARGSLVWNRQNAGSVGVGASPELVVGSDALSRLTAWRTTNGESLWTSDEFERRQLTAPLVVGKGVWVGDFQGYMHWLDTATGKAQARLQAGSSPIVTAPVALADGTVVVVGKDGGVHALRSD